jgi:tellurium resistance protein TerD
MAINLEKTISGQSVNLLKKDPSLKEVNICLGWQSQQFDNKPPIDIDVSLFVLDKTGQIYKPNGQLLMDKDAFGDPTPDDFIFYNHTKHSTGAIIHSGDSRDGASDGDDEVITLVLSKLPDYAVELTVVTTIFNAQDYRFGQVRNAYVRIDNAITGTQLYQYDLSNEFSTEISVEVCSIAKINGNWLFKGNGNGLNQGLDAFCKHYGLTTK